MVWLRRHTLANSRVEEPWNPRRSCLAAISTPVDDFDFGGERQKLPWLLDGRDEDITLRGASFIIGTSPQKIPPCVEEYV